MLLTAVPLGFRLRGMAIEERAVIDQSDDYFGATVAVVVFKVAALLAVLGALVTAADRSLSISVAARIGLAFGAIVGAATFAFFAYVLQYLRDIRDNTD